MDNQINTAKPYIMHIDLNSCFATIEQQANPLLRDKPLVVAAYNSPNGAILSPSITAKTFGIKTGMRIKDALLICPKLIVRTPDPNKYRDVHKKFMTIFSQYSPIVVAKSIDEAVLNFSPVIHIHADLLTTAKTIKTRIKTEIGEFISCSIGIGTNMFLAKLGASIRKPDGLIAIDQTNILSVYKEITLLDFYGINTRYQTRLNHVGIYTPMDMFHASQTTLRKHVFHSILGEHWFYKLRGWETDRIEFPRKTYGHQYALGKKTKNITDLYQILMKLTEKMGRRLRKAGYVAYGIHVAIRFSNYTYWHKGKTVEHAIWTTGDLYKEAKIIFNQAPLKYEVTLISVHCFNLNYPTGYQESLFSLPISEKLAVTQAVDAVNNRWGEFTLTPATMMQMNDVIIDRIAFGRSTIDETALNNAPIPFLS